MLVLGCIKDTAVVDVHAYSRVQTRVGGEPVETREMNTPSWRDDVSGQGRSGRAKRLAPQRDITIQQRQLSAVRGSARGFLSSSYQDAATASRYHLTPYSMT